MIYLDLLGYNNIYKYKKLLGTGFKCGYSINNFGPLVKTGTIIEVHIVYNAHSFENIYRI